MEEPAMKMQTPRGLVRTVGPINANTVKCCGIHLSQLLGRPRQEEHLHHLR